MSIRLISYGTLIAAGVALLGTSCGSTDEATDTTSVQEERSGEFCGGIAGFPCSEGFVCVDDPSDDCDPNNGGADCGGICLRDKGKDRRKPRCNDPSRIYVSRSPDKCAAIRFFCEPGKVAFFDDCGCGCEPER